MLAADDVQTIFDSGVVDDLNPTAQVAVNLVAGERVAIAATSDEFDPQARLRNSAGGQLRFDRDSGPGNDALISHFVAGSSGQYIVEVSAESGAGAFDLRIDVVTGIDLESDANNANDSISGANAVAFSVAGTERTAQVAGTLSAFDVDHYRLGRLNAGEVVSLDAIASLPTDSTLQPFVSVVDALGVVIADSDATDGVFSGSVPSTGEYFAQVNTRVATIDGSRFVLTESSGSWNDVRAAAVASGGDLASIESANQNELLHQTFSNHWIGLSDAATEGAFIWSDGTPLTYTNWRDGSPDSGDFTRLTTDGRWINESSGSRRGIIESDALPGDLPFSGKGFRSQYVLEIGVTDDVAPVVTGVDRLPDDGGTLLEILNTFTLSYSESLDESTLVESAYELRGAGPDGLFGGADDIVYGLAQSYSEPSDNNGRRFESFFTVTDGPLVDGLHRLTIADSVTDAAGNALDGDGDGTAGGDFVLSFSVDAVGEDVVFEGRDNGSFDKATELTLESDTVGGTGWLRSQRGVGSIDPTNDVDWWKFDGLAGDQLDVHLVNTQLRSDDDVDLYKLNEAGDGVDLLLSRRTIGSYNLPSDGTYFLRVDSRSSSRSGGYQLQANLNRLHEVETEDNGSVFQPDGLAFDDDGNATVAGTIFSTTDRDFYFLGNLNPGESVDVDVSAAPQWSLSDPLVEVFRRESANSSTLILLEDTVDARDVFSGTVDVTGDYYAVVSDSRVVAGGSEFTLGTGNTTRAWTTARSQALNAGGDLASFNSLQQQERVLSAFGRGFDTGYWIGLSDASSEGTFTYSDGSPVGYQSWSGGTPESAGNDSNRDYVLVFDDDWFVSSNNSRQAIFEFGSDAEASVFSRPGIDAQYVLTASVRDEVPPSVVGVSRLPEDGGTLEEILSTFTVSYSESLDQLTLVDTAYELRGAGPDGLFGGADDIVYGLVQSYSEPSDNNGRRFESFFTVTDGLLVDGEHRLTIADSVTDAAGNALDGDGDGTAGGDFVLSFSVDAVGEDVVFEGRDNGSFDKATELTLESDTVGGTGWLRSQRGVGSIDPTNDVDWWKFDGLAGDQLDVHLVNTQLRSDDDVDLYKLNEAGDGVDLLLSVCLRYRSFC